MMMMIALQYKFISMMVVDDDDDEGKIAAAVHEVF